MAGLPREAVWIQEARESAKLEKRLQGLLAPPLVWMGLGRRPIDQQEDSEPEPPKGERHKELVDERSLLHQAGARGTATGGASGRLPG